VYSESSGLLEDTGRGLKRSLGEGSDGPPEGVFAEEKLDNVNVLFDQRPRDAGDESPEAAARSNVAAGFGITLSLFVAGDCVRLLRVGSSKDLLY